MSLTTAQFVELDAESVIRDPAQMNMSSGRTTGNNFELYKRHQNPKRSARREGDDDSNTPNLLDVVYVAFCRRR